MGEAHEIGQRVDPVPANFEIGLRGIGPGTRHRHNPPIFWLPWHPTQRCTGGTPEVERTPRILVAILAGNLVDPGVNAMAEGDRLLNVVARSPRPLRESDHGHPAREHHQASVSNSAVQIQVHFRSGGTRTLRHSRAQPDTGPRARARDYRVRSSTLAHGINRLGRALHPQALRSHANQDYKTANGKITNIARYVRQEKVMSQKRNFGLLIRVTFVTPAPPQFMPPYPPLLPSGACKAARCRRHRPGREVAHRGRDEAVGRCAERGLCAGPSVVIMYDLKFGDCSQRCR